MLQFACHLPFEACATVCTGTTNHAKVHVPLQGEKLLHQEGVVANHVHALGVE